MNFNIRIKELREQNNYTQKFVSNYLGIRQQSYLKYENGKSKPDYEHLIKIAKLYDVTVDSLLED